MDMDIFQRKEVKLETSLVRNDSINDVEDVTSTCRHFCACLNSV